MSRVAKNPIVLPQGVEVALSAVEISVKGPLGVIKLASNSAVKVEQEGGSLVFKAVEGAVNSGALSGTLRAIVANMVTGVSKGFERKLEVNGVGFRVTGGGQEIELALGFSHPVKYRAQEGVQLTLNKMEITVSGIDKQKVGQTAAEIRALKKPEPYKGKGIKYADEQILRKAGKAGK